MASTDYSLRGSRLPRVSGGTRRPFVLVAAALFVVLMGSNMATALYAVYRQRGTSSPGADRLVLCT